MYTFILYIAGNSPHSVQALTNLKTICADYFPQAHRLEIVDVTLEPDRGLSDGIFVAPTLVKLEPKPKKVILGSLSDISTVLSSIGWNGTSRQ
jgi:circadian clock protein KaiB